MYYSNLTIPLEQLRTTKIESFNVAKPEDLLTLKQGAFLNRKHSEKGEKDKLDILSLLFYTDINFKEYIKILKKIKKESFFKELTAIIKSFQEPEYFNMIPRELKLKKKEILEKLKKI